MNKVDLYHKFECEIQKLNIQNRNLRSYSNLTSEEYKNLEFAKRQLLLHDQWCCSFVHPGHHLYGEYFHHTFPISVSRLYPYYSLFYYDMIKWYEYYFVESENDSLIERLHKNNRRSIMNIILKRMEEPTK
jgi:hypothetical protein